MATLVSIGGAIDAPGREKSGDSPANQGDGLRSDAGDVQKPGVGHVDHLADGLDAVSLEILIHHPHGKHFLEARQPPKRGSATGTDADHPLTSTITIAPARTLTTAGLSAATTRSRTTASGGMDGVDGLDAAAVSAAKNFPWYSSTSRPIGRPSDQPGTTSLSPLTMSR